MRQPTDNLFPKVKSASEYQFSDINDLMKSENHKEIINRCLDTLIGFSKSSDVRCRQFSMFALGNLASDPQNLDVVMQGKRFLVEHCASPIISDII